MVNYSQILSEKYKNSEWTLNGDDYSGLTWLSETPKPTKKHLDDLWSEVETKVANDKLEKITAKQALLTRLGLTEEEAKLLLS